MEKFTRLTGVAAPLPMVNVDTDMVIPKTYLKGTERTGLGKHLLLNGLDDIGQTMQHAPRIDAFEAARRQQQTWLPSTAA